MTAVNFVQALRAFGRMDSRGGCPYMNRVTGN
jgi:hypothetical protein